ncbi:MAG: hypothetical protein HY275_13135 [Gemmatimonadetes bacterium]|nr:hypothetical protein [Gemmatimonadota bacterium]
MLASILRLFALRPLFTTLILGIPIIVLIVIGLAAVLLLKLLFFVVLPIVIGVWLLKKIFGGRRAHVPPSEPEPVATV